MRKLRCTLWLFVYFAALTAAHASAPNRIALLIGNQGYAENVGPLATPHNNVNAIAASLDKLGFDVQVLKDASYRKMDIAIRRYVNRVRKAGDNAIGFFYYAGHGVANPDTKQNFLVPVDVTSAKDQDIWYQSFQQDELINRFINLAGKATHYVVFDSCRNELNFSGPAAKSLGADKGFVPVADNSGILIAYATAPGRTVSDQSQSAGSYADTLAAELLKPGIEAVTMFRNVQIKVKQTTGRDPWLSLPALPAIYLAGINRSGQSSPTARARSKPAQPSGAQQADLTLWAKVKDSKDPAVVGTYLEQFPKGLFAPLARVLMAQLSQAKLARLTAPATAPSSSIGDGRHTKDIQRALKKLGCYGGSLDGKWGPGSKRALRRALGQKWAARGPSIDVLRQLEKWGAATCAVAKPKNKPAVRKKESKKVVAGRSGGKKNCLSYSKCVKYCQELNNTDITRCARYCTRNSGSRSKRRGWRIC